MQNKVRNNRTVLDLNPATNFEGKNKVMFF